LINISKVNFDTNVKFDEIVKFDNNISSISSTSSHPLDVVSHFFLDQKEIFGNQKGIFRLDNGIVTVVIWMLSWQHQQLQGENISCNTADG
jgi:hypothetical protein